MKKILWVSRHQMTGSQVQDLERIYGEFILKKFDTTVNNVSQIIEAGADCNVLAVVLPPNLLAELVNPRININMKPVIRSVSDRVPAGEYFNPDTGKREIKYNFVHNHWEKIVKIDIITERL